MWQVSKVFSSESSPWYRDGTNDQPITIFSIGDWCAQTSITSSIVEEILDHRQRLLYKVDKNRTLAKITEKNAQYFVWKNIICQFGIPKVIISNNVRQFDNDGFKLFYSDLAISNHFFSPGHLQANGQVKITNKTILRNLKARLEKSKSEWAEYLLSILWAYNTTSRILTGEMPYSMVYGT